MATTMEERILLLLVTCSGNLRLGIFFLFFQNEATFPLVKRDNITKSLRESFSDRVQEYETTYIAFRIDYLV